MYARIYSYGDSLKVVWFKNGLPHGRDEAVECVESQSYDEKLSNNISRARGRVLELALCNPWEWFVTLTIAAEKQDRSDLGAYVKDLGNFIGNFNKKYGCKMKYLLVPELHKDGKSWHMHGLLHDVPDVALVRNEYGYMDMPYYKNRFGYISLSPVKSHEKVSRYITKYISKDIGARLNDKGEHLFYASKGLSGKVHVCDCAHMDVMDGAFESDYTISKWISDSAERQRVLSLLE